MQLRHLDILGMRASRNWFSSLAIFDLEDVHLCKGKSTSDTLGDAFDLNLLTFLCRALVRDVNVYARTGLLTQIIGSDRKPSSPLSTR